MPPKKPLNLKIGASFSPNPVSNLHVLPWRVLVVDDDADVHTMTRMILTKIVFKHRPVQLLSAYSAAQAYELLAREENIAVILLDVVMETEDAGLRLVKTIRDELNNHDVRIILRTGQPGQAPEERVIVDYDINDYKAKSELTAQKLFTAMISALRSYETIVSLNKTRRGLEKILHSSDSLFKIQSMHEFASGILTQLSLFLECKPQGIICIGENTDVEHDLCSFLPNGMAIIAVTDEFECCLQCNLDESCRHTELSALIHRALNERKNQFDDNYTAFYLDANGNKAIIALVSSENSIDENDRHLLEVFTSKISIAMANAIHYQKMVSFEKASVTDFLTGLNNRRQLLRLGVPFLAASNRNNTDLALAMLDIDYFKRINDTYGHDVGDIVLRWVGKMLNNRFRRSDVIARYGGEEFCILAPSLNTSQAFELFDNFRASLAKCEIPVSDNETLTVTVSIGVTTKVCGNLDDMIATADRLLYQAKRTGRNCVIVR